MWRSYYANRRPAQAIPRVGSMTRGDRLFLGYRHGGTVELLGQMRLGRSDAPLDVSAGISDIVLFLANWQNLSRGRRKAMLTLLQKKEEGLPWLLALQLTRRDARHEITLDEVERIAI